MKIALVSMYVSVDVLGPRYISSYLKRAGHDVRLIFLTGRRGKHGKKGYSPQVLGELVDLLDDVDLVGVSLMTNTFRRATEITRAIRQARGDLPIVWGGVHPTVAPETCTQHVDMFCIGEGEKPMLELADRLRDGRDPADIPGIATARDGKLVGASVWPLADDLDTYPFPDFDLEQQYVLHDGHLVPARPKLMRDSLKRYRLLSTRGCPFQCAFCNNSTIQKLYQGNGQWVRKRSVENVVAELETVVARFDSIRAVKIVDDLFFVRNEEEMQHFCDVYSQRVGLPFEVDAHPATMSRGKIDALVGAGLYRVNMGIQSGSDKTNFDIFNRPTSRQKVAAAIDILADYPHVQAEYHYIVANPFEPAEQMIETLYFAAEHHRGYFKVDIFPLAFFPGSPLHQRAIREGIINGDQEELYSEVWRQSQTWRALGDYLVVLLTMVLRLKRWGLSARATKRFVSIALSRPVRAVFDRFYLPVLLVIGYVAMRLVRNLIYQPFIRPFTKRRRPERRARAARSPVRDTAPAESTAGGAS